MNDIKQLAGTRAEFHDQGERIPDKATIWQAFQTEIALHTRTKQRHAELVHQLGETELELARVRGDLDRMTASYGALKAQLEDAMSMAIEPGEVTDWGR